MERFGTSDETMIEIRSHRTARYQAEIINVPVFQSSERRERREREREKMG